MGRFTEIYSFRLNVTWDTNVAWYTKCCMGQSVIQFLTKICLLDWVCTLIRKYKLPFSFKAATPCCINKCL